MNTNKTMESLAPFAIDYTEQLAITGGRTVVTCVGNTFDPRSGSSTYDCLYSEDGKEPYLVCEVPDNGRPPAVGFLTEYP